MEAGGTYILTGGGTGGHLFPGIAVADELISRDQQARVLFVGSERELEQRLLKSRSYDHMPLPTESLAAACKRPVHFLWRNWRAYRLARKLLKQEQPAAVIGLGGFASVPVVLAAFRLGIPIILLEQNVVPGRATKWLSRKASLVCLSFSQTASYLRPDVKTRVTGNPVRRAIAAIAKHGPALSDSPKKTKPTLLILGGSQGAMSINAAMLFVVRELSQLLDGWEIIHQTGPQNCGQIRHLYNELQVDAVVEPFFDDMVDRYQQATLVVSRAGATTLAELSCAGVPVILVPYPHAAGNHQFLNASAYELAGAAVLVEQAANSRTTARKIATQLKSLLDDAQTLKTMQSAMQLQALPDATTEVVTHLLELSANEAPSHQRQDEKSVHLRAG